MKKSMIFGILGLLLTDAGIFYLLLPVISIRNIGLWLIVLLNAIAVCALAALTNLRQARKNARIPAIICLILAVTIIVGAISGARALNARAYSAILDIKTVEHVQLPVVNDLRKIPLMDTESSKQLGNRKIGSLNEIVSQYEVSDSYMTISYKNDPVKVAALKYADFWKWNANRKEGIPGYVIVYPNDLTADYVELKEGMIYVPSARFSEDLARHIWVHYPTVFFDNIHFEIDDSGKPYYVASTYEHTIGLFGGKKITGAIIVDPVTGEMNRYSSSNLPKWVDIVYNGDYIATYFDIYGRLINGFWNSIFGQKGLIESTTTTVYNSDNEAVRSNDFGYIVRDDDVLVYTGVTAVTNDESNVGYLMANERTGEISVSFFESTDEDSVMRAAEGEVQEKGYRASFPSLIEVNGMPAYVMVLKDNLGLVKLYAVVDAAQYSHMTVAESLEKAITQFSGNTINTDTMKEKTITVKRIELITEDGNTMVYLVDEDNNIYCSSFLPEMLLIEKGDTLTILTDGQQFTLKD